MALTTDDMDSWYDTVLWPRKATFMKKYVDARAYEDEEPGGGVLREPAFLLRSYYDLRSPLKHMIHCTSAC